MITQKLVEMSEFRQIQALVALAIPRSNSPNLTTSSRLSGNKPLRELPNFEEMA